MPQPTERTLAVIGSASVGKSALTLRFVRNEFPENYDPTINQTLIKRFRNKTNGQDYQLTLYDTAGLDQQEGIPQNYIESHGFILVYSIADRHSFENVNKIYEKLLGERNTPSIHLILIGNKTDLNDRRRVTYEEGCRLVNEWRSHGSTASFIETSARTGERVEEVFSTLLNSIDSRTNSNVNTSNINNNSNGNNTNDNRPQQSENDNTKSKQQCTIC